MSLTTALGIAQSALQSTSRRTSVVSQNIANAGNADYSRRNAVLASNAPGVYVAQIQRASNEAVFRQNLGALSAYVGQSTLQTGLDTLAIRVNGVDNASSASAAIGDLQEALQLYAASPSSRNLAENVLNAARQAVTSLNNGSAAVQAYRGEVDTQISDAVTELNALLADFEVANNAVVSAIGGGRDPNDALDKREALLKKIAEYVPVNSLERKNGDLILTTADGVTLFETVPRKVSFAATPNYGPAMSGNPVYVDGVPLDGGIGGNTTAGGKIAGMIQLRDSVSTTLQSQLDEVARGLISSFAETGPDGTLTPLAGLFTWPGGPAMPADGTIETGLASTIQINAAFLDAQGGSLLRLRDGGANGVAYAVNTSGAASFSDLLIRYGDNLDRPVAFDPNASGEVLATLAGFSASSIGWLEQMRQQSSTAAETKGALAIRTAEALSNETGVNIDQEMSLMLELEHAFEASARIIRTVDEMFAALLSAVG